MNFQDEEMRVGMKEKPQRLVSIVRIANQFTSPEVFNGALHTSKEVRQMMMENAAHYAVFSTKKLGAALSFHADKFAPVGDVDPVITEKIAEKIAEDRRIFSATDAAILQFLGFSTAYFRYRTLRMVDHDIQAETCRTMLESAKRDGTSRLLPGEEESFLHVMNKSRDLASEAKGIVMESKLRNLQHVREALVTSFSPEEIRSILSPKAEEICEQIENFNLELTHA